MHIAENWDAVIDRRLQSFERLRQERRTHDIVDSAMKQYEDYSGGVDKVESFTHSPPAYQ